MIYRFYYYTEECYNNSKDYIEINIYMLQLPNVLARQISCIQNKQYCCNL